jgi:hypothetical protein
MADGNVVWSASGPLLLFARPSWRNDVQGTTGMINASTPPSSILSKRACETAGFLLSKLGRSVLEVKQQGRLTARLLPSYHSEDILQREIGRLFLERAA